MQRATTRAMMPLCRALTGLGRLLAIASTKPQPAFRGALARFRGFAVQGQQQQQLLLCRGERSTNGHGHI